MSRLRRRFALAAGAALLAAGPAGAQTGFPTGTADPTGPAGGGGSSTGLTTTQQLGSGSGVQLEAAPALTGISISEGARSSTGATDPSNSLGAYYAAPGWQGRAGATQGSPPGGFGQPLYGTTSGGGLGSGVPTGSARAGVGTGTAARTGTATASTFGATTAARAGGVGAAGATGFGGTADVRQAGLAGGGLGGAAGGFGRAGAGTNTLGSGIVGGQVVPAPRNIAYTSTLAFPVAGPVAQVSRLQSDVRGVIERSVVLSNPRGIEVAVADAGTVVLRGGVRDEGEARLAEGMIRLTPGVRDVQNQLTYPRPGP